MTYAAIAVKPGASPADLSLLVVPPFEEYSSRKTGDHYLDFIADAEQRAVRHADEHATGEPHRLICPSLSGGEPDGKHAASTAIRSHFDNVHRQGQRAAIAVLAALNFDGMAFAGDNAGFPRHYRKMSSR